MDNNYSSCGKSSDEEEVLRDFDKEAQAVLDRDLLPTKSGNRYNSV